MNTKVIKMKINISKSRSLLSMLLVAAPLLVQAQTSLFTVSYSTSLPLSGTADYTDDFSWRGMALEERYFIERDLSVGFYIGWNVLNKELINHTEEFENAVLFGNQYRYLNVWPLLVNTHYHFLSEEVIRPYVGLGAGMYSVNKRTEMGLYANQVKSWQFGFQPEAGIWIDMAAGVNLILGAKYNYALKSSKAGALSYLNFNAGLCFVY